MLILDYLSMHWEFLILFTVILLALRTDIHLDRKMRSRIAFTDTLLLMYSFSSHLEKYLGEQPVYTILRTIMSAIDYSLMSLILLSIILIMFPQQRKWLALPAVVGSALCFLSIPTKIVFFIDENNHFHRGALGYTPYVIAAMYLIYLFFCLFRHKGWGQETCILLICIAISACICFFVPLIGTHDTTERLTMTIAVNLMLYYVILLQKYTRSDPLTGLLNRQSYYADLEKYAETLTAITAIDMNGLKEINDQQGHTAGDAALAALAECFRKAAHRKQRVYRIGGDEFAVLCLSASEEDVRSLTERIRTETAATPYSCSVGYAMRTADTSADDTYRAADAQMYIEKQRFYAETGKQRQKIR